MAFRARQDFTEHNVQANGTLAKGFIDRATLGLGLDTASAAAADALGMAAFHAEKLQRGTGLLRVGHAELQMPKLMSEP
jgi:hypothetical protein